MITPSAIKELCLKAWKEVLRAEMEQTSYFPMVLNRIGRISAKDILSHLVAYREEIGRLQEAATTWGYELVLEERNFDKIGFQRVPVRIIIPSLEVYLRITRKRGELDAFSQHLAVLRATLPQLEDWAKEPKNILQLQRHETWKETLSVCQYFLSHPSPHLYRRELPIEVHTKYIEQNEALIRSLLDYLLPASAIQADEKLFDKRYGLKYAEPLLRLRFLDPALSPVAGWTDVSLPLSQFQAWDPHCRTLVLAENKMNFLAFPPISQGVALWSGGGFNISYLQGIDWIANKELIYWGDLDAHGMQILHQCRSYYPQTRSFLMDLQTFRKYPQFVTKGSPATLQHLPLLTFEEQETYRYLQQTQARLEQEHIQQTDVNEACQNLGLPTTLVQDSPPINPANRVQDNKKTE